MNLYSKKQRWKIVLVIIAVVIVGASLWYSSYVTEKIRKEEIRKVQLWANDVRSNIGQLNVSEQIFKQQERAYNELTSVYEALKRKERKEVERWAAAMQEMGKEHLDYTFFVQISQENKSIPVILTDNQGNPTSARNIDLTENDIFVQLQTENPERPKQGLKDLAQQIYQDSLRALANTWQAEYQPIEITIFAGVKNRVYYRESDSLRRFQTRIDAIQEKTDSLQNYSDSLFTDFNERLQETNTSVPMIFIDTYNNDVLASNLDEDEINTQEKLVARIKEMKEENTPIEVRVGGEVKGHIYYENSSLLTQLRYFPFIQFGIIGLFLFVAYLLFSTFRRAEQNQVWVGMAKETAHQLGTPLSSLMAWSEMLEAKGTDPKIIKEINKDLERLSTITDRFSKIGSGGELQEVNVVEVCQTMMNYLQNRVSKKTTCSVDAPSSSINAKLNVPLFEWVIENLSKNAIDAMEGKGELTLRISVEGDKVMVDISDTGKGIPAGKQKTVFEPGYTTKKRGWGLGLSLTKRIIEDYHKGKVYVKSSEAGKGTTFRIELNK